MNTWCMAFVQHKTYPVLPDDITILNQLGYNTLDLNRLGSHARMHSRVERRISAAVSVISLYYGPIVHLAWRVDSLTLL